jgi:undecaprenyl-diphosphatase
MSRGILQDRGLLIFLALLLLTGLLSLLAALLPSLPGDREVLLGIQTPQGPWLERAASIVTFLARPYIAVASVFLLSALLWLVGKGRDGLLLLLALPAEGLVQGIKVVMGRERPPEELLHIAAQGGSFPSGHTFHAFLFFGLLIYLAGHYIRSPWLRLPLQGLLLSLIPAVGLSRVYLGAHWPSDVVGGYLYGGLFLLGLLWLRRRVLHPS